MNVTILGTGYVGLTTGVCLAYLGHKVTCVDVDQNKIQKLEQGESHFHEPFINDLMAAARANLSYTTRYADAIPQADVIFIAVGTPQGPDGRPDLKYLNAAASEIGSLLGPQFTVVVNKSTVPIGSAHWVKQLVGDAAPDGHNKFAVASNPEFLREGCALADTLYPDRVVIGTTEPQAAQVLADLYAPLIQQDFEPPAFLPRPKNFGPVELIATDPASSELIKYAANAFLALKISYINEIGALAGKVGADISHVSKGIGLDSRIGPKFLSAGIGWGGSCFPKDTAALVAKASEHNLHMQIVQAARDVNARQRQRVVGGLLTELGSLEGKTVGVLGLSFKPDTDDLRDSPAIDIIRSLLEHGAVVKAFDPIAMDRFKAEQGKLDVKLCPSAADAADGSDALLISTEWPEFGCLDWKQLGATMKGKILFDGRNLAKKADVVGAGFRYLTLAS